MIDALNLAAVMFNLAVFAGVLLILITLVYIVFMVIVYRSCK